MVENKLKINVLVTGASGQLGTEIINESVNFDYNYFLFDKNGLDISNFKFLEKTIEKLKINVIVNCAAYTKVDDAESNRSKAFLINSKSVENLVAICLKQNIKLIHISTDYVFDGLKTTKYQETDSPSPINIYGKSKLSGENKILNSDLTGSIIIRTSWLFSASKNNFVSKILENINSQKKIKIINDEFGSPTNAQELANFILTILPDLKNNKPEIFHYCNDGICSRLELANEILKILKINLKINSIYKFNNTLRPKFSALSNKKVKSFFGIEINNWKFSLNKHLTEKLKLTNAIHE